MLLILDLQAPSWHMQHGIRVFREHASVQYHFIQQGEQLHHLHGVILVMTEVVYSCLSELITASIPPSIFSKLITSLSPSASCTDVRDFLAAYNHTTI